ncbi:glycosyltransferase [Sulfurospirillum oryzae]|uniref:glycosyltransferase n=1 Tax=Sulfurospirillum oryzae TaxID=2976535 RepID=UPI0021E819B0|nr:hypothetical protein [Sulfurospirillum oryzae]
MKIFMGLSNPAGYFTKLQVGFNELGLDSFVLDVSNDVFQYQKQYSIYVKILKKCFIQRTKGQLFYKFFFVLIYKLLLLPFFIFSLFRFNVFIFGTNKTFFRFVDLPILKLFNKKIIFVYFGSDSRPPYMSGIDLNIKKSSLQTLVQEAKRLKAKIIKVEKYADIIINNPASGQFHEKNFINWMCIGMPTDIVKLTETYNDSNKIIIVHAPSRPITKGSNTFREIIQKLQKQYDIDYIELVNCPNNRVIEALQKCDFILDEVYSDVPLGGLSTEAAAFQKVSIVTGYYSSFLSKDIPSKNYLLPSIYNEPEQLESDILYLIQNIEIRKQLGEATYQYINQNWSSLAIAKKFIMLINKDFPQEWIYQTEKNEYIFGYGISKDQLKIIYKEIIDNYGIEGFFLQHNDAIQRKILDFLSD